MFLLYNFFDKNGRSSLKYLPIPWNYAMESYLS